MCVGLVYSRSHDFFKNVISDINCAQDTSYFYSFVKKMAKKKNNLVN